MYLEKLKSALDYFEVREDLIMEGLTETDNQLIYELTLAADGKEIHFNEKNLPRMFYTNKNIGNISIRILARKEESSDGYKLFSAFTDEAHVRLEFEDRHGNKRKAEPWSLFFHMKAEDFQCSNINYNKIFNSIKAMRQDDLLISIINDDGEVIGATNMLLEILKAYDSQVKKDKQLLQFAVDISTILLNKEPESILNKLQAVKRQRNLTNEEIASLVTIRNKNKKRKEILCAISILLDETENANKLLSEMSEEEKKQIENYPIYNLFIKNANLNKKC